MVDIIIWLSLGAIITLAVIAAVSIVKNGGW